MAKIMYTYHYLTEYDFRLEIFAVTKKGDWYHPLDERQGRKIYVEWIGLEPWKKQGVNNEFFATLNKKEFKKQLEQLEKTIQLRFERNRNKIAATLDKLR